LNLYFQSDTSKWNPIVLCPFPCPCPPYRSLPVGTPRARAAKTSFSMTTPKFFNVGKRRGRCPGGAPPPADPAPLGRHSGRVSPAPDRVGAETAPVLPTRNKRHGVGDAVRPAPGRGAGGHHPRQARGTPRYCIEVLCPSFFGDKGEGMGEHPVPRDAAPLILADPAGKCWHPGRPCRLTKPYIRAAPVEKS
jgi:hypothetical protein